MAIEKYKNFLIKFAYFAIIIAAVYVVVNYGLPMLSPFVIGAVLAYLLRLPVRFLSRKLKMPYKSAAILVAFLFFVILGTSAIPPTRVITKAKFASMEIM